jgi:hypothetical protein
MAVELRDRVPSPAGFVAKAIHPFATDSDGRDVKQIRTAEPATGRLLWSPDGRRLLMIGFRSSLSSIGVPPDEPADTSYRTLGLDFEWMGAQHVSWQPAVR